MVKKIIDINIFEDSRIFVNAVIYDYKFIVFFFLLISQKLQDIFKKNVTCNIFLKFQICNLYKSTVLIYSFNYFITFTDLLHKKF